MMIRGIHIHSIHIVMMLKMIRTLPVILMVLLTACSTTETVTVDGEGTDFGHRIEGETDGRRTVVITPAGNASEYEVSPAPYETVDIRIGRKDLQGTPIELLIKGSLPDACTELHGVNQTRNDAEVIVQIQSRRPSGALCATVIRPYRFYLALDGAFAPGQYALDLNGRTHQFSVP
jgi:hypothetical protein